MIKNRPQNSFRQSPVSRLYDYIVEEGFSPGDKLPVREKLGCAVGVGPRRLREALRVLEHQGVLESRNKGGTVVRKPTAEKLAEPVAWYLDAHGATEDDLLRARASLEGAAAFEAAQRKTARDLLHILDALEQLEARQAREELDWAEERTFHIAILNATHNPVMLTFERIITSYLLKRQEKVAVADAQAASRSNAEHRKIYDAIDKGDAPRAMTLMYEHIAKA
jgi:GntR family transcriptional repressor for pyruvate dehydrogenase complex